MSGGEFIAFMVCTVVVALRLPVWLWWYLRSPRMGWPTGMRWTFALVPALCAAALLFVLKRFSSLDVRDSGMYNAFYFVMGVAWTLLTLWPARVIGLGIRDDVIDRRNPAAAWAVAGLLMGVTLSFAGGNIGHGPGWWVVIFCALLATGALYLLWAIAEPIARFCESITVERDTAAGIRMCGFARSSNATSGTRRWATWRCYARMRWSCRQGSGRSLLTRLNAWRAMEDHGPAKPLEVRKPRWYRALWYRALVALRYRRNSAGGFGAVVPVPSQGRSHGFG